MQSQRPGGQELARPPWPQEGKEPGDYKSRKTCPANAFSVFSLHKPASTSQDLQVQLRDPFQSQFQMPRRLASVEADIQNNHVARITIYLTDRLAHGICLIP